MIYDNRINVEVGVRIENIQILCLWLYDNLDKWEISTSVPKDYTGKLHLINLSNTDWIKNSFKVRGFHPRQMRQYGADLISVTAYLDNDIDAMAFTLAWS